VTKARNQPHCSLVSLRQLASVLEGQVALDVVTSTTLQIQNFSAGYRGETDRPLSPPSPLAQDDQMRVKVTQNLDMCDATVDDNGSGLM